MRCHYQTPNRFTRLARLAIGACSTPALQVCPCCSVRAHAFSAVEVLVWLDALSGYGENVILAADLSSVGYSYDSCTHAIGCALIMCLLALLFSIRNGFPCVSFYSALLARCTINMKEWTHLAFVYDSKTDGGTQTIFINGSPVAYEVKRPPMTRSFDIKLSRSPSAFQGSIRQLRIWNHARTGAQLKSLMTTSLPKFDVKTEGLTAVWPLEQNLMEALSGKTAPAVPGAPAPVFSRRPNDEDIRSEATSYLAKHKIHDLLAVRFVTCSGLILSCSQSLTSELIADMPSNPYSFMIEQLKKMARAQKPKQ